MAKMHLVSCYLYKRINIHLIPEHLKLEKKDVFANSFVSAFTCFQDIFLPQTCLWFLFSVTCFPFIVKRKNRKLEKLPNMPLL